MFVVLCVFFFEEKRMVFAFILGGLKFWQTKSLGTVHYLGIFGRGEHDGDEWLC